MKKHHQIFFLFLVGLFGICTAKAESQQANIFGNNEEIYLCTKDIDALNSIAAEMSENGDSEKSGRYCAASSFENELLNTFRHCFLMIAKKITANSDYYYLESDQSLFGYGSEDSEISPPANNSKIQPTSKLGNARAEILPSSTPIACAPVLTQDDIHKTLVDGKEKSMFYWWTVIQNYMHDDAESKPYDTTTHNCCTVASDAVKKAGGHLESINFASFNNGLGTVDKNGIGVLNFLGIVTKLSSDSSKSVSRHIFSSKVKGANICQITKKEETAISAENKEITKDDIFRKGEKEQDNLKSVHEENEIKKDGNKDGL